LRTRSAAPRRPRSERARAGRRSPRESPSARAEGEGFEPSSEESPPKRFSRPPHSTTLPPLRGTSARLDDRRGRELASRVEEAAQEFRALTREQAPGNLGAVVQAWL